MKNNLIFALGFIIFLAGMGLVGHFEAKAMQMDYNISQLELTY